MSFRTAAWCMYPYLRGYTARGLGPKLTKNSPFGERIYQASLLTRLSNPFQGYHVTREAWVADQIARGYFDNKNYPIYFWPVLAEGTRKSPLIYGGNIIGCYRDGGCWEANHSVVILRIGSCRFPQWSELYKFPLFPPGPDQSRSVAILGAWRMNPAWAQEVNERYPRRPMTLEEKQTELRAIAKSMEKYTKRLLEDCKKTN